MAPFAAAWRGPELSAPSPPDRASDGEHVPVEGTPAAATCGEAPISSSEALQTVGDVYRRVVPLRGGTTSQGRKSTSAVSAERDRIDLPSPSLWVNDCDEEARAPGERLSRSAFMAARSPARQVAAPRSPMTKRRSAQCPTRKAAFTPSVPSRWSRYSGNEVQPPPTPAPQRLEGYAFDLGHHLEGPVDVPRPAAGRG